MHDVWMFMNEWNACPVWPTFFFWNFWCQSLDSSGLRFSICSNDFFSHFLERSQCYYIHVDVYANDHVWLFFVLRGILTSHPFWYFSEILGYGLPLFLFNATNAYVGASMNVMHVDARAKWIWCRELCIPMQMLTHAFFNKLTTKNVFLLFLFFAWSVRCS